MQNNQNIIFILGSPRSGLKLLSDCLHILGFTAKASNQITPLFFQDMGLDPIMAGSLPDGWQQSEAATKAKKRIKTLLTTCNQERVIAEPGICRIMPLWLDVFQEHDIAPSLIHIIRHPYEVALSLQENKGIDLLKGHLIWLAQNRDVAKVCQSYPTTLITFDQLLADPVSALARMGTELDLTWPNDPWSVSSSLLDFVQPNLKRHHASNLPDKDKHAFQAYERLYQEIRRGQWAGMADGNAVGLRQLRNPNAALPTAKGIMFAQSSTTDGPDLVESLLDVIGQYEKRAASRQAEQERIAAESGHPLFAQVVFPSTREGGEIVETIPLIADEWEHIVLPVPEPKLLRDKPVILKPLNTNGTVMISAISIVNRSTGDSVWYAKTGKDFDQLTVQGTAVRLPDRDRLVLLVTGNELKVSFTVPDAVPDCSLKMSLWVKATRGQASFSSYMGIHDDKKIEPVSQSISKQFCQKLAIMNNTWDFHHQFSLRKQEFKKISSEQAKGDLINAKTFWGREMKLVPSEVVSATIYSFGFLEPNIVSFCADYLITGQIVLDVGAHIGFFSMLYAELVGKCGKVFSFEPTPSTANILKMNTAYYPQVVIVPKLAWHTMEQVEFHNLGKEFSAYNTAVADRLGPEQKIRAEDNRIMVDAVALDEFVLEQQIRPDLVKLDVESAEMHVLKGMKNILDKSRPVITIEVGDIRAPDSPDVPTSRELLEFVMQYDYLPLESVGGRYQAHELKTEKYAYDNIIIAPIEKLPIRRPLGTVAVQQGNFF